MMDSLYRLIYFSHTSPGTPDTPFTAEIEQILNWSRAYNPTVGVTGALLASSGRFAQVLEGPFHALRPLFGNIACDPRHRSVTLLQFGAVSERHFGNWSMAFVDEDRHRPIPLTSRPPGSDLGGPSVSSVGILELLRYLLMEPQDALTD